jgi:ATP-binding cassette subfamily B protein
MAFGSVVAVLWYGAQSVLSGDTDSRAPLGQFLLYSVFAASSLGALSEVWGELSQAAGAAERLSELLDEVPEIRAPASPKFRCRSRPVGDIRFDDVAFRLSRPPRHVGADRNQLPCPVPARPSPSSARPARAKSTLFSLILRFYDATTGNGCWSMASMCATPIRQTCAPASPWCRRM